jgi:hypothetical protein
MLPLLAPIAFMASERDPSRRRAMAFFVVVGAGVTAVLVGSLIRGPVHASVADMHISYDVRIPAGIEVTVLYVIAACGAPLLSRRPAIVGFGVANLVAVAVLAWAAVEGFASMWCMWAALTSVLIDVHLRHTSAPQPPTPTAGPHHGARHPAQPMG